MPDAPLSTKIAGKVVLDEIVPAGDPWGAVVRAGDVLTIIDLVGQRRWILCAMIM